MPSDIIKDFQSTVSQLAQKHISDPEKFLNSVQQHLNSLIPKVDSFTQITLDQEEDGPRECEEFINFNFSLQELDSRQLVNSWNIKDPLQYKRDLQATLEPDLWQWVQNDQIIYSQSISIFIDQEVVKSFSQDEDRLKTNANYGNYNKNGHLRKKGMWS